MGWTSPRTWLAGEYPTASDFNTHIRDNFKAIGDAWTAYTPSWTAATSNPAIGNGTLTGAYAQAGKLAFFRVEVEMGSTTTYGSGTWRLSLPVAPADFMWQFHGVAYDSSAAVAYRSNGLWFAANNALDVTRDPTSAGTALGGVTATLPFAWATGDVLSISGVYEGA